MEFLGGIAEAFAVDEPILLEEIRNIFQDEKDTWIYARLREEIACGRLMRFCSGVYYLPKAAGQDTGEINEIDVEKVIERKYICSKTEVYGFYTGETLLRRWGIIDSPSLRLDLVSNSQVPRSGETKLGDYTLRIRRCKREITRENAQVLQLLELMTDIQQKSLTETQRDRLKSCIEAMDIQLSVFMECSQAYPSVVIRTLVEQGYLNKFARSSVSSHHIIP